MFEKVHKWILHILETDNDVLVNNSSSLKDTFLKQKVCSLNLSNLLNEIASDNLLNAEEPVLQIKNGHIIKSLLKLNSKNEL